MRPTYSNRKKFTKWQESSRKDVERVFGVLKKKFAVLTTGIMKMDLDDIIILVQACIILHNMMVEERMNDGEMDDKNLYDGND